MNTQKIKCETLVWLNVMPDDETYTTDDAGEALNRLKNENNLSVEWNGETADFGFGHCEMYTIEGNLRDIVDAENIFYQLCNDIAEERADKEDDT